MRTRKLPAALPTLCRGARFEPQTVDLSARTADLVWTAGAVVRRMTFFEGEIDEELVIDPGAVRLGRLNAGAPLLDSHNAFQLSAILGVVVEGSARLEGGSGLATVRFSEREDVGPILADISAGIIRNVSVGYRVHEFEIIRREGQPDIWRAVDWEPLELSLVAVPADAGAQIRAKDARHPCKFTNSRGSGMATKPKKRKALGAAASLKRGAELSALLNGAIDDMADDDTPRADIIEQMGSAAGISASTVNSILNEEINCPPIERLEGFAEVLGVSVDDLIAAGEADGCDYSTQEEEERNMPPEKTMERHQAEAPAVKTEGGPDVIAVERRRVDQIFSLCERHGVDHAVAKELIASGAGMEEAQSRVLGEIEATARSTPEKPAFASRHAPIPGPEAKREFENFGEYMFALRYNQNDQRLASLYRVQEAGAGSTAGFAIPQQFRPDILSVSPQTAVVRPRASVIPAGSPPDSAITIPAFDQDTAAAPDNRYGGVSVAKVAEGGAKPETSMAFREIKLEPHEFAGTLEATDKALRNWQAFSSWIENQFRLAMIGHEDREFLTGNGVGGPLGVLNAGATVKVNREVASKFSYTDLTNMAAKFMDGGTEPVWLISKSVMPELLRMRNEIGSPETGDGSLIWHPDARDSAGNHLLMGWPIIWHERAPLLGNLGDVGLYDFSRYLVKDGSGPFVAASEHVKFTENKTVFKIFWNVDGQPWLTQPFTQEGGYEVSPFVVLDVPSG